MKKLLVSLIIFMTPIFIQAGQKPASGTSIDTSGPFYNKLVHAWGMLEGSGATTKDSLAVDTITLSGTLVWATVGGDAVLQTPSGTGYGVLASSFAYSVVTSHLPWSIAFRAKLAAADNNGMMCGDDSTSMYIWFHGSATLDVRAGDSNSYAATFPSNVTSAHDYVLTSFYDGSNAQANIYQDGVFVSSAVSAPALWISHIPGGYSGLELVGDMHYFYIWNNRVILSSETATLASNPYTIFTAASPSETFTLSQSTIPANHNGVVSLNLTGTNSHWASTTTFQISGVSGISLSTSSVINSTQAVVKLTMPGVLYGNAPGNTGTLSVTDTISTATVAVGTPTLSLSPTSGSINTSEVMTLTGVNTIWNVEVATGLYSTSGGTGVSIGTPTIQSNLVSSATFTNGSSSGTIIVKDLSTGATNTFTATITGTIYDMSVSTAYAVFLKPEGGASLGNNAGVTSWGLSWNDGSVHFKGTLSEIDANVYSEGQIVDLFVDKVLVSSVTLPSTNAWGYVVMNSSLDPAVEHDYILTWAGPMFIQAVETFGGTGINQAFLPTRQAVAFFGDSIILGDSGGTPSDSNRSFPHLVGMYFNYQVFNRGMSSSQVSGGASAGAGRTSDITAEIPGAITVVNLYGTNDAAGPVDTAVFSSSYTTMLELTASSLPSSVIVNERLMKIGVGDTTRDAYSTVIGNVVTTLNDSKITYKQGAWSNYDGSSGVHPTYAQCGPIATGIEQDIIASTLGGTRMYSFGQ